jgi:Immunity protein 53
VTLESLQAWYSAQCNGEWEHQHGVTIATLDNPGWSLKVDLVGTALAGKEAAREVMDRTERDWFQTWSDGHTFNGVGGNNNLGDLLTAFDHFARPT